MYRRSRIQRISAQNEIALCFKSNLTDPRVVEIAGIAGFHAIWLCQEHVPCDWSALENCIRAAKLHDLDTIVRVTKGSYSDYIKPLECDATGIMVPHVTSADEAREIVARCRFHPLGERALDGGNADAAFTGMALQDYFEYSNHHRFIILQIESPQAVQSIDEIAAVPGYDYLLFGPGDYAHRIGKAGVLHHPEVLQARAAVEEAAARHGKSLMAVAAPGTPSELWSKGYRITNLLSDVGCLSQGMSERLQSFYSDPSATRSDYLR